MVFYSGSVPNPFKSQQFPFKTTSHFTPIQVKPRLKTIPISRLENKNHTQFMTKMAKISQNRYLIYDTKRSL